MNGNESMYGDPYETALLEATERNAARSAALRKAPRTPLATPSHGVEDPGPGATGAFDMGQYAPQDVGLPAAVATPAPRPQGAPDYRAQALRLMEQAASAGEPTEEDKGESNRRLMLALTMGTMGGESFQP